MADCPVCGRDVTITDGTIPVHYNSGLLRCDASNQPTGQPKTPEDKPKAAKKAVKKAAAKR